MEQRSVRIQRMVDVAAALALGAGLALVGSLLSASAASAATTASLSPAGRLTVTGTAGNDTISVRATNASTIQVTAVGINVRFPASSVHSIQVNAGGGNDIVRIADAHLAFTTTRPTTLDGGAGNDTIRGGKGAETLRGGTGNDTVTGLRGNDHIDLGAGTDLSIWTVGQGADQVTGGPGPDTQRAVGTGAADAITLAKQGGRARIAGGPSSTSSTGVEALVVQGGGGPDTIDAGSLAGLGLTDLTIQGGAGDPDIVTVTGTAGPDTLSVTGPAPNQWTVTGTVDAVAASVQAEALQLAGGDDVDTLTIPELASDVLYDAGAGNDVLVVTGTGNVENFDLQPNGGQIAVFQSNNLRVNADGVETLTVLAGNGGDAVHLPNLNGSDLTTVNVDVGLNGVADTDADQVIVSGTQLADVIQAAANGPTVQLTGIAGTANILGSSPLDVLSVNGDSGNDTVSGGSTSALIDVAVFGDDGNDTINGSNGADTLVGGSDNDTIDGNGGLDTAFGGDGDDLFVWDPGDSSDVLEGQLGVDTMRFNGSAGAEIFAASSSGGRLLFTRNVGLITMDTNDVEAVELNALGSSDTATINNLASTDVTSFDLDLGVNGAGDAAVDAVTVNGTAGEDVFQVGLLNTELAVRTADLDLVIDNPELANDSLTINGSGGDDGFFGGAGTNVIKHTWNGGNGNDVLSGTPGNDVLNGENNDDTILGGAGNDTINCGANTDFADGGTNTDSQTNCEAITGIP